MDEPRTAILALGDSTEAMALRAVIEGMGGTVLLLRPGSPAAVCTAFREASRCARVILSGPGTPQGFVPGAFGPGVDTRLMEGGALPPGALTRRLRLDGVEVISTACHSGGAAYARAFAGAARYTAPRGAPSGAGALLWLHLYLFRQGQGDAPEVALASANRQVPPEDRFQHV